MLFELFKFFFHISPQISGLLPNFIFWRPTQVTPISLRGLPMIDRGDIRQAIDRCSNIWASLPGAGYGQFEHKADSLIAKFKEAGGTVREIEA